MNNVFSKDSYARVNYSRGPMKLNFFVNALDGDAVNLLSRGADGELLPFVFENQTYDLEFGNLNTVGDRHVISYGANARLNRFRLSMAPGGSQRSEGGVYVQDEIFLSDLFRWTIGGRVDKFDILDHAVFSPRTAFMVTPSPSHAFRVSFNRGYRAPSLVNTYLDIGILNNIDLGLITPQLSGVAFPFPVLGVGNEQLREVSLTAYEVGYTGTFNDLATVSAVFYVNDTRDDVFFTQIESYTSSNPPPGWPLPPPVLDLLVANNAFGASLGLPSVFSYRNFGRIRDKGVELGLQVRPTASLATHANYSWQAEPEPKGFDLSELNLPARHRVNLGVDFDYDPYFENVTTHFTDRAFWQDVLDIRFHGTTESYTLLNAGFGVRWRDGRLTTIVQATNLTNTHSQQHIFGDIIKRRVQTEVRVAF